MIDLVLIAPVRAYREALAMAVDSDPHLELVAGVSTGAEAVGCMVSRQPSVALLDFSLDSLVPLMASLRRTAPSTRLVGIGISTAQGQSEAVVRGAEAGVAGFVDADQPLEDVLSAIRLAARGESPCSPRIAALLLRALQRQPGPPRMPHELGGPSPTRLTPRELVVAELAARGLTNRQIASRLVVGESTVKSHIHAVLSKLQLDSRDQIALVDLPASTGGGGEDVPAPPTISLSSPRR